MSDTQMDPAEQAFWAEQVARLDQFKAELLRQHQAKEMRQALPQQHVPNRKGRRAAKAARR